MGPVSATAMLSLTLQVCCLVEAALLKSQSCVSQRPALRQECDTCPLLWFPLLREEGVSRAFSSAQVSVITSQTSPWLTGCRPTDLLYVSCEFFMGRTYEPTFC